MKKLIIVVALVLLAGCARWYKDGIPASQVPRYEREADEAMCDDYAARQCMGASNIKVYQGSPQFDPERSRSRGPKGYGGPPWTDYLPTDYQRCVSYYYKDCAYSLGWYRK